MAKALYQYQVRYVNRNHEHMEFFGGALLGVQVVRFRDADVMQFYDEVLDVDYHRLVTDIRRVDTINHEYKVAGDVFNLTLIYVLHGVFTTKAMTDKDRVRAGYDTAMIFFYRCVAALLSYYFRYPADPKIAQMAYANLSDKFLIKKLGSWYKVMDYRALDMVDPKGLHYANIVSFKDDTAIVYAISDMQGRIRDMIKNYYAIFKKMHEEGQSIAVTSSTWLDADGEETIREKTTGAQSYRDYMLHTLSDKNSLIRDDLISVIVKINVNTSFRMVKSMLVWLSDNFSQGKQHKEIEEFVTAVMVQSVYFIEHNMEIRHKRDYPFILSQLKNLYLSTRTEDKDVERIRELGHKLVVAANKGISEGLILSTRTSLILYLSLRGLVGKSHS